MYNVGKIKEDTFPGGKIVSALSGSKAVDVSSNSIISDSSEKSNSESEIEGKSSKDDAFVVTDDGDLFFGEESGALDEVNPDDEPGRTYGGYIVYYKTAAVRIENSRRLSVII